VTNPLRVLQVHNQYRPGWGGEDTVADLEADLLRRNGHEVERLSAWTSELEGASAFRLIGAGFGAVWSSRGYSAAKAAISRFSPDILHAHNTFPLLSPSVFWAANQAGVPVVQTIHNYRLTCAGSLLLRDNQPCQDCVGHFPWPALRHRCYGSSFFRTAAVTAKNVAHRGLGTFESKVQAYVALTEFSRDVLVRAGLPPERIFVKPNFTPAGTLPRSPRRPRMVFVGSMARSKGPHLLLDAWARLAPAGHQLSMVGDGPERAELEGRYAANSSIVWHGFQSRNKVMEWVAASQWLVLPSLAYESCPMAVLEAFSVGTPVIVPNHGSFADLVSHGQEGLLFSAGDAASLTLALRAALQAGEGEWRLWSAHALCKHRNAFTEEVNYRRLMFIYQEAIEAFQRSSSKVASRGLSEMCRRS
jgi:glycosyltransferase involved in cell wall biosynthesis